MADEARKKIWFNLNRFDDGCVGETEVVSPELFCVEVYEGQKGQQVKQSILQACDLAHLDNIVLKLRNSRGSLVPISGNLPQNSNTRPFTLEVVNIHQHIQAQPRTVKIKNYNETMREKLTDIVQRIEKLEEIAPKLNERRAEKINNEMHDIEQMLEFLQKRIKDAESVSWKGMFKKNPLW